MKTVGSALKAPNLSLLEEDHTKHALCFTNDNARASVVLVLEGKLQKLRYPLGRCNLKESALYRAIVYQTKDWLLTKADRNFASLESVSANRLSPLRLHLAISIQPHALTNRMSASAITAPLRADRGRSV